MLPLYGCDRGAEQTAGQQQITELAVWAHAGQEAERQVLTAQVARFNDRTPGIRLHLTFIPERDYNAQVQAAALADDLPDLLEFDGPYLYNYIWQGQLAALDDLLDPSRQQDLLPSITDQGTYAGHLYGIGVFDSGLGLYARQSALEEIGARIPTSQNDAWSAVEFAAILNRLATHDPDGAVLDLKLNYTGEWFTYGFSPVLQSAGADLIDRNGYQHSHTVLDSPTAVKALSQVQGWIDQGLVDPNLDDRAFVAGRTPLSWVGHWEYGRYSQAFPKDLLILPLPDFGHGSRTGQGSWIWGITRHCKTPQAAARFLDFLLAPDEVLAMSNANGAVPGTRTAVARSPLYGAQGPLRLFARQLMEGGSAPRPKTPAYPVITTAFQTAFQNIRNHGDVAQALATAAGKIDQDIADNQGYPQVAR